MGLDTESECECARSYKCVGMKARKHFAVRIFIHKLQWKILLMLSMQSTCLALWLSVAFFIIVFFLFRESDLRYFLTIRKLCGDSNEHANRSMNSGSRHCTFPPRGAHSAGRDCVTWSFWSDWWNWKIMIFVSFRISIKNVRYTIPISRAYLFSPDTSDFARDRRLTLSINRNLYLIDIDFEPESNAYDCTHDNCIHNMFLFSIGLC